MIREIDARNYGSTIHRRDCVCTNPMPVRTGPGFPDVTGSARYVILTSASEKAGTLHRMRAVPDSALRRTSVRETLERPSRSVTGALRCDAHLRIARLQVVQRDTSSGRCFDVTLENTLHSDPRPHQAKPRDSRQG